MEHAFLVTVRFHDDRYHGLNSYRVSEWPPSPARLFQAFVAGVASGATIPADVCVALDQLETCPPPVIAAPRDIAFGKAYRSYVPNNDLDATLPQSKTMLLANAVSAIRVEKQIKPILFDAKKPILYCWPVGSDILKLKVLCAAANCIYQLGRGIDMVWAVAALVTSEEAEKRLSDHGGIVYRPMDGAHSDRELLCPAPGLQRSLAERFQGMRNRFQPDRNNRKPISLFVQPPKPKLKKVAYCAQPHRFVFEIRNSAPPFAFASQALRSAADLVQEVRNKAAQRLYDTMPDTRDEVDRYLIGRGASASDKDARVRIVPIPSVGNKHADSALRRVVAYVPQSCPLTAGDLAWAFTQVAWWDVDGVIQKELQRVNDSVMVQRFERCGRRWRSLTPLALPSARRRRIGQTVGIKGASERVLEEARATAAVHQALRHAGISASVANVSIQREPFYERGHRAESFASGTRFTNDMLWHSEITFTEPVAGPLLLGDGRFLGLGLMYPSEPILGVIAFEITGGLYENATPLIVSTAARRAMMARVQNNLPYDERLPSYVSGHQNDGTPSGDGTHRHIAVAADLPRGRLLYIAPIWLQRSGLHWSEIKKDHRRTEQALKGLNVLRAGAAGKLTLVPTILDRECDPLFAPARVWQSVTDYHVTRHHRRLSDEEAIKADVLSELERRGWPQPQPNAIEVLAVRRGSRGRLSGRLRLRFSKAQHGPLLIGSTAHKGGGLFSSE